MSFFICLKRNQSQSVFEIQETIKLLVLHDHAGCGAFSATGSRKQLESSLNECKYDLMVLNQDLGKVVPSSELALVLESKGKELQEKIEKIEAELDRLKKDPVKNEGVSKKFVDEKGEVRIWGSGAAENKA